MQEPPKIIPEELSYKQALEMHMHGSQGHKARIYIENAAEQMEHPDRAAQLVRACALEIDISEETVYARISNEDQEHGAHLVRACAVEMHMDLSEETVYARISNEDQKHGAHLVRACAVEMHMDISCTMEHLSEN